MFGGAPALQGIGRVVWAIDDPWGGSGRRLAWEDHPAMQQTEVVHCPGRAPSDTPSHFAFTPPEEWQPRRIRLWGASP